MTVVLRSRRQKLTVAAVSAGALLLAGCGAGGPASAGGKVSGDKIVLGVITDESGVYADLAGKGSVVAAKMAVADFKKKYGDKAVSSDIEVIDADHQDNPDTASSLAQQFYGERGADAIFDVPTSSAMLAVAQIAGQQHKIFMDTGGGSTDVSNDNCNKYTFHYGYDTYMLASGTASAITQSGGKSWFITYPNYDFGQSMNTNFTKAIKANGGTVVGTGPSPFPNPSEDYSSILLAAKQKSPQVLGAMQAGGDLVSLIKQYNTFKLKDAGIQLAIGLLFISDVNALGADALAGDEFTDFWYWNFDDQNRSWADRWQKQMGTEKRPTSDQAAVYSSVMQYLEAAQRAGTDDSDAVVKQLEGHKFNDMFARNGEIRKQDHVLLHDVYLAQVKSQSEMSEPWDYEKIVKTIPGEDAFQPLSENTCHMS
ncbi:MAG TPA: ABC transporter substrate-binding protein [Nocardioidaceae bacterium]|nr:ABC transporter substrate-binding protein [Nocardioidaceae bacterium]